MVAGKVCTGSKSFDLLLDKGYDSDIITTIYGPAGAGKTTACLLCAVNVIKRGKKVIFIDTEGGFSIERFKQLDKGYKADLGNILLLKPTSFKEQKSAFERLKSTVNDKIGLIIVDTISMLYRVEFGKEEEIKDLNRELGQQIAWITEIARKKQIPVLLTNQVYADFNNKGKVKMVGGDILKYGSKCLIELQNLAGQKRKAILVKHRSLPRKETVFEIKEEGFIST